MLFAAAHVRRTDKIDPRREFPGEVDRPERGIAKGFALHQVSVRGDDIHLPVLVAAGKREVDKTGGRIGENGEL